MISRDVWKIVLGLFPGVSRSANLNFHDNHSEVGEIEFVYVSREIDQLQSSPSTHDHKPVFDQLNPWIREKRASQAYIGNDISRSISNKHCSSDRHYKQNPRRRTRCMMNNDWGKDRFRSLARFLTFCLSKIFIAKNLWLSLCCTSITRPKEPVPKVLIRSKSSKHAVFCSKYTMTSVNYLNPK